MISNIDTLLSHHHNVQNKHIITKIAKFSRFIKLQIHHLADFICSISCSSMSQARSITLLATVSFDSGTRAVIFAADSPNISRHTSPMQPTKAVRLLCKVFLPLQYEEIPCKKLLMLKHLCEMKHTFVSGSLLIRRVFS